MAKKSAQVSPTAPSRQASVPALLEPTAPKVPRKAHPIKVRATRLGYLDHVRRRPGDVFTIDGIAAFSPRWMEMVDPATPNKITTVKQALEQAHDEILGGTRPTGDADPLGDV